VRAAHAGLVLNSAEALLILYTRTFSIGLPSSPLRYACGLEFKLLR
jgi:hypothetical protein